MGKGLIWLNSKFVVTVTYVFVVLFLAISAWVSYHNAQTQALNSLKLQALALAHSIETSLMESFDLTNKIFKDLASKSDTATIAYIALYDNSSRLMFHSDENLVGELISKPLLSSRHSHVFEFLDDSVFAIDMPVNLHGFEATLRVALNTKPFMQAKAEAQLYVLGLVVIILIATALVILYLKALKKAQTLMQRLEAQRQFAVLGEMSAVLAHEIRNPLGSIKGFAQYLKEKLSSKSAELDIIISEATRLEHLTEALLSYCKQYELNKGTFAVSDFIHECVQIARIPEGIALNVDAHDSLEVTADRDKLKQAVLNILQNAISANPRTITIRAYKEKDSIKIEVIDDGEGMDAETASLAFKPFFTTRAKGTGLGLAICERIIASHSGEISLRSALGKGTKVTISLSTKTTV